MIIPRGTEIKINQSGQLSIKTPGNLVIQNSGTYSELESTNGSIRIEDNVSVEAVSVRCAQACFIQGTLTAWRVHAKKIAKLMNSEKYKSLRVSIEGHTDHTASRDYNQKLSERRAAAVKDALVADGVDAGRLQTAGHGEDRPISPNVTPEQRANNRRIEFKVVEGNLEPSGDVDRLGAVPGAYEPTTTTIVPDKPAVGATK